MIVYANTKEAIQKEKRERELNALLLGDEGKPPKAPEPVSGDVIPPRRQRSARESRDSLTQKMLSDFEKAWDELGESVIARTAAYSPDKFLQIMAKLLPQQIDVTKTNVEELTDERIGHLLDIINARIAGAGEEAGDGEGEEGARKQVTVLPSV